ncbi:MAG: amidohydrolase family protein, partial [Planctomycetota bacterium]|nr:amidohydrolase family protein [Planctomycetota bacterium]
EGLDARRALRAMTRDAAKSFCIDERVGAIEKGKDADLVFLSGEPFSLTSRVMEVMVEGRIVYEVEDAD